ncbi:MAG: tetratricopeptide repeat protein [Ginsengibacter sp.]
MQKIIFTLLIFFVLSQRCFAQFSKQIDSLCMVCNRNTSDSQKVITLGVLANYYNIFYLNNKADSVLEKQLLIAELSNNSNLILAALFGDAIENISSASTSESFDKTISFIQKGIDYAQANKEYNYLALGYDRMSDVLRRRGQYENALSNSLLALSVLENVTSDSVKAETYISLGDIYHAKGEEISACTNYNNAFDIAMKINSVPLQSRIYHCVAEMYKNLENQDLAKEELNKSLALNKKYHNVEGMVFDYFDLSRLTDEKYYIDEAVRIADSLQLYKYLINAKRLRFAYTYVVEKDRAKALHYLQNESELKESFLNSGIEKYYQALGNIYLYSNDPDSDLYYYQLALPAFEKKFDEQTKLSIYSQIATSYALKNNYIMAIEYYLKALKISEQTKDRNSILTFSDSLSGLYEQQNDFKNAFIYTKKADSNRELLRKFSKEKDIALMMVDRENRKHEQELLLQKKKENIHKNIQFMAITVVLVIVFFLMLFIGSFQVSKTTVKIMGYFFFISLFEFIVLLIDQFFIKDTVNHQPLKIWLIKIGLIGLLAPCQHFLERNLIALLASKKLIEVRSGIALKRWWNHLKKSSSHKEGLEEDTALL